MLSLFESCYAPMATGFALQWQRRGLPRPGAVGDQPARVLQAFELIANVKNAMLAERRSTTPDRSKTPTSSKARRG